MVIICYLSSILLTLEFKMIKIGPFFYVYKTLIYNALPVEKGRVQADKVDNPYGHERLWDSRFKFGDYINYPRGRVIWDKTNNRAIIYIKERPKLATGARWHHERYDGGGYPDGLSGEQIPEEARIIAVADAYDAMTSRRSYRDVMAQDKVRSEIERCSGTQFDPRFAEIMLRMIDEDKEFTMRENETRITDR